MEIHTIDLHFQGTPHTIASYLLLGSGRPLLVETGPATTRPALIAGLATHGLQPSDIGHVFLTHIHLDHAGDAGWWSRQGAQIYVHPVGAPHLVDPSRLLRSATRIYGSDMDRLWGDVTPAPAERVTTLRDEETVAIGDISLQALDTPGHASHHFVYRLGEIAFTGDAAGIRTPSSTIVGLPAPPPEFNRDVWLQTLHRLRQLDLSVIYPTHFGRIETVSEQLDQMAALIIAASDLIHEYMAQEMDQEEMVTAYVNWVKDRFAQHDLPDSVFHEYEVVNPFFMSVAGMTRYWRKREG